MIIAVLSVPSAIKSILDVVLNDRICVTVQLLSNFYDWLNSLIILVKRSFFWGSATSPFHKTLSININPLFLTSSKLKILLSTFLKTGPKKLIVSIKKTDLAKESADARPEVFSPGNALDAKIIELDYSTRRVKLSVKAAQIDEEKSLIAKFGEGATKSGATLKGIFEKAIGKKAKKEK